MSRFKKGFIPWNKGKRYKNPKVSLANKGKRLSIKGEFKKGHIPWNKGKKGLVIGYWTGKKRPSGKNAAHWRGGKPKCLDCKKILTVYRRKRCRDCFNKFNIGSNHPQWKGGIYPLNMKIRRSNKYKEWAKAVKKRDNYICQNCKKKGGILHSDHIKSFSLYPELRFNLDNGRTLCMECHQKTPTHGRPKSVVAKEVVSVYA